MVKSIQLSLAIGRFGKVYRSLMLVNCIYKYKSGIVYVSGNTNLDCVDNVPL